MNKVYVLLLDPYFDQSSEILGVYSSLFSAMQSVPDAAWHYEDFSEAHDKTMGLTIKQWTVDENLPATPHIRY